MEVTFLSSTIFAMYMSMYMSIMLSAFTFAELPSYQTSHPITHGCSDVYDCSRDNNVNSQLFLHNINARCTYHIYFASFIVYYTYKHLLRKYTNIHMYTTSYLCMVIASS